MLVVVPAPAGDGHVGRRAGHADRRQRSAGRGSGSGGADARLEDGSAVVVLDRPHVQGPVLRAGRQRAGERLGQRRDGAHADARADQVAAGHRLVEGRGADDDRRQPVDPHDLRRAGGAAPLALTGAVMRTRWPPTRSMRSTTEGVHPARTTSHPAPLNSGAR